MQRKLVSALFLLAALYDGVLGLTFAAAPEWVFERAGVTPPNHPGYVQFPALLLLLFAVMFLRVAMDPVRNRELILYGCGLKVAYCSLAFGYLLTRGIPSMWIPWAWADLVFLALFAGSWIWARGQAAGGVR